MHFSVPDTQELKEEGGSVYMVNDALRKMHVIKGYNIHINGVFHCTVRYRQLHNLHDQLKKEYGPDSVPFFPPKKIFPLSASQLEERRVLLEKYIQSVCQDTQLVNSDLLNGFLLSAQQETTCEDNEDVPLNVYLMNGAVIPVNVSTTEKLDHIVEKVCQHIGLPKEHAYYFSLFLIKCEEDGDIAVLRKLLDFESPYISQKTIKAGQRIILRKSYWDPGYDLELMCDHVALNLLYIQTVADVEKGWILCNKETQQELASLQARGDKKQYIEVARTLKYYGYLQFQPCLCDYPQPNSVVLVSVGNRELNVRLRLEDNDDLREGSFKVTRMRCWRITTLHSDGNSNYNNKLPQLELSFEYLMSKDKLQWVTIASQQAILMSVCLQSMVDELLLKKTGTTKKQHYRGCPRTGSWSYMKRDGSSHVINFSQSASTDAISSSLSTTNDFKTTDKTDNISSMKKFSEKLSNVSLKFSSSKHAIAAHPLIENDAFEGIGDDDL